MPTITLLNGKTIPPIIYGTGTRRHGHATSVGLALKIGYRAIDTASSRKFHEEASDGQGLVDCITRQDAEVSREDIFVQTKFTGPYWHSKPWPYDVGDEVRLRVLKSFARSIQDLQIDVIDAYLLHGPMETFEETMIAWRTLEDIVCHGGIRYLGICNVDVAMLQRLFDDATVKPAIVQNEFRDVDEYDKSVKDFCQRHGMIYQIFGLFWSGNIGLLHSSTVRKHAHSTGLSVHQALQELLRACFHSKDLRLCVAEGTSQEKHAMENLLISSESYRSDSSLIEEMLSLIRWK